MGLGYPTVQSRSVHSLFRPSSTRSVRAQRPAESAWHGSMRHWAVLSSGRKNIWNWTHIISVVTETPSWFPFDVFEIEKVARTSTPCHVQVSVIPQKANASRLVVGCSHRGANHSFEFLASAVATAMEQRANRDEEELSGVWWCHTFWGKHSCYYVRRMLKVRISDRRVTPQFRPWYASTVATFTGNWSLSFAFQINWSMKFFWALYGVMMPCRSTRVLRLRKDRIDSPPLQGGSELGCAPSSHLNLNNAGRKRCWDVCFAKNLRVCIFF